MAEQCRTVRVSGLPTDIKEDRLTDKLYIYFLRARNGGGEIASVTIVKATPGSALITFEDIGVARSVLQHGRHILKVDGKKYELILSEPHKDLDPNKVILSMSVTVDYSQLPGGKAAVTSLDRSHDVQIHYNNPEQLCTLQGLYSQVQAALAQILGLPGALASTDTPPPGNNGVLGVPTRGTRDQAKRTHTQEATDHHRRGDEQRERTEQAMDLFSGDLGSGPYRDFTSGSQGWEWEGTAQAEGGAVGLCLSEETPMVEEDLSLIMDADMYLYLQRHCGEEYQEILTQHGVEVVDVTADGVTTLFLQRVPVVGDIGQELEHLRGARGDLSRLYQENEARLRRAHLPKSVLSPRGGLSRAVEGLRVRLPKLLLSEDDRNVYIVGNSSNVSEAKQFLLLGEREEAGEDVASLLRSSGSPLDTRIDKLLKQYETERRTEGARGYKFAPCFKALGPPGLGTRLRDTVKVGDPSPSIRPGLGPMLGHDLFSLDRTGSGVGGLSRPGIQSSGEDILFKRGGPLFTHSSMENGLFLNSMPTDFGQQGEIAPFTSTLNNRLSSGTENQERSGGALTRHGPGRSSLSGAQTQICMCGESGASLKRTRCGVTLCPQCLLKVHVQCRVCLKAEVVVPQGIQGNISYSEMPFSLPGHGRDAVVKITYCIPNGIQGEGHPSPGSAFRGGVFEAYLPLCDRTRKLLPRLEKAFRLGLTFTVTGREPGARVSWDSIPHKTSLQGGKSGNGYPDSTYLICLSEVLRAHGIEEAPAKSQDTNKT